MTKDQPAQNGKQQSPDRFSGGRPLHVLLIEDDDAMRDMLAEALRRVGCKVTECENASRWIKFCVYNSMGETDQYGDVYDVVVSDIRMPDMSGLDVMKALRDSQCIESNPPTIFITAFGDEDVHQRAKELGAAAVLDKPFDTRRLIQKVWEVISL